MRDWLVEVFPRAHGLAELADRILDTLDEQGFLPVWGWSLSAGCSKLGRGRRSYVMQVLVSRGYVEVRDSDIGRVYLRSDRFMAGIQPQYREVWLYRESFPWTGVAGPVKVAKPRKGRVRTARRLHEGIPRRGMHASKHAEIREQNTRATWMKNRKKTGSKGDVKGEPGEEEEPFEIEGA